MNGVKTSREYQKYERKYPACPCCALRMSFDIMEGHLYQDHSAVEYVNTLIEFAHAKFRRDRIKSYTHKT